MKRKLVVCVFSLLLFAIANAQDDEANVFTKVEVDANTNPTIWRDHVRKATQLPDSILKNIPPGIYKINVQFIVDKHGNIGQVKAKNDPGYGLGKRDVNAILTYKGAWQPASQCGGNVNAYKEQPVTFIISAQ